MGGTPHIRIGLDTLFRMGEGTPHITPHNTQNQGGDTAQENVFRCSHWGGDTAQENVFRCSHLGGDTAQNSK